MFHSYKKIAANQGALYDSKKRDEIRKRLRMILLFSTINFDHCKQKKLKKCRREKPQKISNRKNKRIQQKAIAWNSKTNTQAKSHQKSKENIQKIKISFSTFC